MGNACTEQKILSCSLRAGFGVCNSCDIKIGKCVNWGQTNNHKKMSRQRGKLQLEAETNLGKDWASMLLKSEKQAMTE